MKDYMEMGTVQTRTACFVTFKSFPKKIKRILLGTK